jgi:hypothetical protein
MMIIKINQSVQSSRVVPTLMEKEYNIDDLK